MVEFSRCCQCGQARGRDVGGHKRPHFAGAGIHRLQDPAFLLDGLARGYHVNSFIKTLGCLWNDLALFDQLRDPPLDAIGLDTFLAQVDRGLNYVGRFEHRLALTRSEEHTSELQSLMRISYAVCFLKKKKY